MIVASLSVVLTTLNEEQNISRCLGSVSWADEIVVVDSFSRDRTVELARQFTDRVYQHEYPGSSRQVEKGITYATGDWILVIDADEEVSPELSVEIKAILSRDVGESGFEILRKPSAFGKWISHGGWFPDYQFRLFRKDGYIANHEEVHGGFSTRGKVGRMEGLLLHHTYETIASYIDKMNDYTSLQVSSKIRGGRNTSVGWTRLVLSPVSHFLRMFLSKKGFKDGMHGFLLAFLDGLYTHLLYAKVWEYRMREREGRGLTPPITNAELNRVKHIR